MNILVQASMTALVAAQWSLSGSQFAAFATGVCAALLFDALLTAYIRRRGDG